MQFTERDARLLRWINGHGSATLQQIARWAGTSYQSVQRRVRQLVDHGYLERRCLIHGDRAHWLTKFGRQICGDELPPPKDIMLGSYRHNHILVDLSLSLVAETGGRFTPERRLRQMMSLTRLGERYHVADGLLQLEDQDKPIAIELELSTKGHRRLKQIVRGYAANLDIGEVWYFVESNIVRRHLKKAAEGFDKIIVLSLPTAVIASLPREMAVA